MNYISHFIRAIVCCAVILYCPSILIAQTPCDPKTLTTNPDVPVNTERPAKINTFDWRTETYPLNSSNIISTVIESPFFQNNNSAVNHFYESKDMKPQDGWELILKDFGYNDNGTPKISPVDNPYIILYNKYTGVLRIFVAVGTVAPFNGVEILLEFMNNSSMQPSLLNDVKPLAAVDDFTANPTLVSLTTFNNAGGKWFYADFPMAYDPCTCMYNSKITVKIRLINSADIALSGSIQGTLVSIQNSNGTVNTDDGSTTFGLNNLYQAGTKAYAGYKTAKDFSDSQFQSLEEAKSKLNPGYSVEMNIRERELQGWAKILNETGLLQQGLKALPILGGIFSFVDFFVSGGKQAAQPQTVQVQPMSINASVQLNGTITANYLYKDIIINNPGALDNPTLAASEYPYYNQVLGVFNLLRTPKVNYVNYVGPVWYWDWIHNHWATSVGANNFGRIFRYKLDNDLLYVLNPATGFESVPEIQAALVFEFDNSPTQIISDLTAGYGNPLLVVEDDKIIRTRFVPLQCLRDLTVEISSAGYQHYMFLPPKVYVKLLVNLKRSDATPATQNVLFVAKYPVTTQQLSASYETHIPNHLYWASDWLYVPTSRTLSNTTITSDVRAWEDITIGNNVTIGSGTYEIVAGREIHLSPTSGHIVTSPKVHMRIGAPQECTKVPQQPASSLDVYTFCNSTAYKIQARNLKEAIAADEVITKSENIFGLVLHDVYPNPASTSVNFRFTLGQEEQVSLVVTNPIGEKLLQLVDNRYPAGTSEVLLNSSSLPSGVYYYTLQAGTRHTTGKFVIVR